MTQVNATYALAVDLNGDLDYGDANEDISAYWKHISINVGIDRPGEHIGRSATLTATLENSSHKFSPQHASALSGFTIGKKLRLQMTYSATTVTLYEGRIDVIDPAPGATSSRECRVVCNGYLTRLQRGEVKIGAQRDVSTDELATAILGNVAEYPAMLTGWFLGNSTWSKLGTSTNLSAVSAFASIETCAGSYDFAGDNFAKQASPYGALRDTTESERGWLFEGRDGKVYLWSRHHLVKDLPNAVDATLTDSDFSPLKYSFGGTLVNECDVNYHPRKVAGIGVVLGTVDTPIRVKRTQSSTVTVRFVDASGAKIDGIDLIAPVAGYDFTANHLLSGRGQDLSKSFAITVKPVGDGAELTFTNKARYDGFVLAGARIRGTRLQDFGMQKTTYIDSASQTAYGRAYKNISATLIESGQEGDDLARWEVANHSTPTGNLEQIGFYANKSAALMAQARDRNMGDRVALSETQTGVNNEYFIIGKRIDLTPQNIHYERWILEPKPTQSFWLLGTASFGNLGSTTYLGA